MASNGKAYERAPDALRELHEFEGDWRVEQRLWPDPDQDPMISRGRTECRVLLDGLAVLMITELEGANTMKGVALMTQGSDNGGLEMAWVDTLSGGGILRMDGDATKAPSRDSLVRHHKNATQERVWTSQPAVPLDNRALAADTSACLPSDAALAIAERGNVATAERTATATLPLRIVENRVSADHWVLEFFAEGSDGNSMLVQQNTFER